MDGHDYENGSDGKGEITINNCCMQDAAQSLE